MCIGSVLCVLSGAAAVKQDRDGDAASAYSKGPASLDFHATEFT